MPHYVRADRRKLALFASPLGMFLAGGIAGAFGFKQFGFVATVPLATVLLMFAGVPVGDDLASLRRRGRS